MFQKARFLIAMIIVTGYIVKAQDCRYEVEGVIYDRSTDEPLAFGTIQIKGTQKGAVADEKGNFKITDICLEEFDLVFSYIGYKEIEHHHDVYHKLPKIYLSPDDFTLESVVIEGERSKGDLFSGSVSTISAKELEQGKSESLADLASSISGVSVLKTGQNIVKPVIHGLHSNRVLIINNGVRHEFQNWGTEHAPEIDPSLIENLQVIKGAATVRYGPDALGGVILIDAPTMELHEALNGDVAFTGKTNGRSGEGTFELHKGFDRTAFMLQASGVQQGDLSAPDYLLTNTGKEEWSTAFGTRYHLTNVDLNFYYSHFDQELGILRASVNGNLNDLLNAFETEPPPDTKPFSYDINEPKQRVKHDLFKLQGRWNGKDQYVDIQYAIQMNNRQEFDLRRGSAPSIDLKLTSQTLDIDWKHPQVGQWLGSVGLQALSQDNNNQPGTNTVSFVPNFNNYRLGVYIIESRSLNNDNWLEFGLRYDYQFSSIRGREPNNDVYRNELNYQNASATIGYKKNLPNGTFRSNFGTAWRPPNISELYRYGRHQSAFEYGLWRFLVLENGSIDATEILTENEKSASPEKGLKWVNSLNIKKGKWDTEFTIYGNYVADYIYSRPYGITNTVRGVYPYFVYDQADGLFLGADVSAVIKHSSKWQSKFQFNYLWAKDVQNNDRFVGTPPPNILYGLNYTKRSLGPFTSLGIGLNLNYVFKQSLAPRIITVGELLDAEENNTSIFLEDKSNFDFLPAPPSYFLTNFTASADLNDFSFLIKVDNIFNVSYRSYTDRLRYFADDLGVNLLLSLKYKL